LYDGAGVAFAVLVGNFGESTSNGAVMADDEFRQGYGKGFPVRADRLAEVRPDKARPTAVDGEASDQAAEGRTGIREGLARRLAALPPGHPSAIRGDRPAPADEAADAELTPRRQDSDSLEAWRDAEAPPSRADNGEGGFWSKVRRFEELWRAHVSRWPDKPDKAEGRDRREDPPGSWCGDGSQYLSPEQNAEADRLIADMRRPEEAVTKLLQEIEQDNPHGGVLGGLEHRLKGTDRLKEKIAEKAEGDVEPTWRMSSAQSAMRSGTRAASAPRTTSAAPLPCVGS